MLCRPDPIGCPAGVLSGTSRPEAGEALPMVMHVYSIDLSVCLEEAGCIGF